ncbi:hypothetical protein Hanom_Chr08g00693581 [Helianthus anomalus]
MGVLGEFKRGVNVAHGDWFGVRERTHLLGEHPLHLKLSMMSMIDSLRCLCDWWLRHGFCWTLPLLPLALPLAWVDSSCFLLLLASSVK